jgi:hypothetical protein
VMAWAAGAWWRRCHWPPSAPSRRAPTWQHRSTTQTKEESSEAAPHSTKIPRTKANLSELENGSRDRGDRGREEAWGMLTSVLGRDWGLVRTRGSGAFESDWTGADDETRWKALPDLSRIYKPHLPFSPRSTTLHTDCYQPGKEIRSIPPPGSQISTRPP